MLHEFVFRGLDVRLHFTDLPILPHTASPEMVFLVILTLPLGNDHMHPGITPGR